MFIFCFNSYNQRQIKLFPIPTLKPGQVIYKAAEHR